MLGFRVHPAPGQFVGIAITSAPSSASLRADAEKSEIEHPWSAALARVDEAIGYDRWQVLLPVPPDDTIRTDRESGVEIVSSSRSRRQT